MHKKLTQQQFSALDKKNQSLITKLEGVNLEVHLYKGEYHIVLYSLYNFYVEFWHDRTTKKLQKIAAFSSYKKLDPFLAAIDLSFVTAILKA